MRFAALILCGCGLGGGDGGGSANLPISGAGPYGKLSDPQRTTALDEPYVLVDPLADITDPSPVELPDGTIRIFYTRAGGEIWRADLPGSLTEPAGDPVFVLAGAAPAVVGDVLFYEQDGAIWRATSTEGGFTPDRVVVENATQPGAVRVQDRFYLYFARPGGIFVATSDDGLTFTEAAAPALAGDAVGEPAAVATDAAGELLIGLFYVATTRGVTAIGYAGSRDGLTFEAAEKPILEPGEPSEHGPAAIVHTTRALLFFSQDRAGKSAIAAATSP